jgi:hypothetical protein
MYTIVHQKTFTSGLFLRQNHLTSLNIYLPANFPSTSHTTFLASLKRFGKSQAIFSEYTWQIAQNVFGIVTAQELSASSCSAKPQQFGGKDADESPICAMDGALRAVASPSQYFHQNMLEALRSVAWNNEEYILCNLPIP